MKDTNVTLIDTHAHIYDEFLLNDIDNIRLRWLDNGVSDVYMPNIDSTSIDVMLALESKFPEVHSMMGLHPCYVNENYKDELEVVEKWLSDRKFSGIGEIGLDYYWDRTFVDEQLEAFKLQIQWAKELGLPIIIHSRDSLDVTIRTVSSFQDGTLRGIFHCFTGTADQANAIIDLGFMMGIGGVVSYKNSDLPRVIDSVPMESIVLETDSPYLPPVPHRGKKNEPAFLVHVCKKLADIKGISEEEVAKHTSSNAKKIFS